MYFRGDGTSDDDYHENGPVNKRSKFSSLSTNADQFSQVNMVDKPKTLGLRLRKSPSFVDLIETKLFRDNVDAAAATPIPYPKSIINKGYSGSKKASNFHASLLRIGRWEYVSRFADDLVAKYYFSKNKLSWELLYGSLKSKIEVSWSDILDLQCHCPETGSGPGFLSIVLARKPLFYIESNPEPRKHTLWKLTGDFTDGQASSHRQHFLQCSEAVLRKHLEFFNYLKRIRPSVIIHSLLFESERSPGTEESSSSFRIDDKREEEVEDENGKEEEDCVKEVPDCDMLKKKGVHRSISYNDLEMNGGQMNIEEKDECENTLENISAILMSDTQPLIASSDEQTLMSRINSFWSLL